MPPRVIVIGLALLLGGCGAPVVTTTERPAASTSPATPTGSAASAAPTAQPSPQPLGWEQLDATGPAAREDHTWTVDGDGRIAYLFGGRDGATVFDDLWAFDLDTEAWTQLGVAPGPEGRFGHEAAWVEDIGLVVFAGQNASRFLADLWAFWPPAGTWSRLPAGPAAPVARYGTCSSVGPDGRLWISHGFTSDGTRFADTWAYDFAAGAWADETPAGDRPISRCLHACWWTDAGALALYGGQTTGVTALGDRWVLEGGAWTQPAGTLPVERNLYAHARVGAATLVFGGQSLDGTYLADLWLLADDAADAEALSTADSPAARAGATMIVDGSRALLFGGRDESGGFGDVWELTGGPLGAAG